MSSSRLITEGQANKTRSRLIKAVSAGLDRLESFETKPQGEFGSEAKIICGDVTLKSSDLDIEFTVKFDDDMEANEAEIKVYNLSANTVNKFARKSAISIVAGFAGDTGVIFKGYISSVKTRYEDADKETVIKCIDDIKEHTISEITYSAGEKASTILKDLLKKTGTPIKVFKMRRDHEYVDDEKVSGNLMENIKKYSEICGVSTFIKNGEIYSRYIKEGDNLNFTLDADHGLIGSPEEFEEEKTISLKSGETNEDGTEVNKEFKDTIKGYECDSYFQHRFAAGGIVELKSREAKGTYRICSGEHRFSPDEAVSHIKMY